MLDEGHEISFTVADLMNFHGPGSPGGVAHAFQALQRALPLIAPEGAPERREITVRTAFPGPGARDGFECVLRAVSGNRYVVDDSMARPELGSRARFVFRLDYRGRGATLTLLDGFVTEEFLELAARSTRDSAEEAHLARLKLEMANRVLAAAPERVYDATT